MFLQLDGVKHSSILAKKKEISQLYSFRLVSPQGVKIDQSPHLLPLLQVLFVSAIHQTALGCETKQGQHSGPFTP